MDSRAVRREPKQMWEEDSQYCFAQENVNTFQGIKIVLNPSLRKLKEENNPSICSIESTV